MEYPSIFWFRQDLRLEDNPALYHAIAHGKIIPVYIYSPKEEGDWPFGGASKWWLHQSLNALEKALKDLGGFLIYKKGPTLSALQEIIEQTNAQSIFCSARFEPAAYQLEKTLTQQLRKKNLKINIYNSSLLVHPEEILTKKNEPYKVFSQFWKTAQKLEVRELFKLENIAFAKKIPSLSLEEFELEPKIDWAKGIRETWTPGEKQAIKRLNAFVKENAESYAAKRDMPSQEGVSKLSPHLHFGEVSPQQILHTLRKNKKNAEEFERQLYWREFAYHLLFHFPDTAQEPLRKKFAKFAWNTDEKLLKAWQKGKTGFPIIDAGMNQLWVSGWMHNRVRLLVASFLTKDLLIPWQEGHKWFWDTLVDADLANNTLGWQWTAGCGADAAPYFRIFNPITQGQKFDPEGLYIKKWVPELKNLSIEFIHQPWLAPQHILEKAGIKLGKNYPLPIINHEEARVKALEEFYKLTKE